MSISREAGRSFRVDERGPETGPLGVGCWALGGETHAGPISAGWSGTDVDELLAALHRALELGVRFFDTADVYGAGRSERLLGQALKGGRSDVVIATKFGGTFDEEAGQLLLSHFSDRASIRDACHGSLRRLRTDYIDLYQFHWSDCPVDEAHGVRDALEELVEEGKIRAYGWSTNDPERALVFAEGPHCRAVQHTLNVVQDNSAMLDVAEERGLVSICRSPLGMGLLTGKYTPDSTVPVGDVRALGLPWNVYFEERRPAPDWLEAVDAVRGILTSGGRTPAQGALAWIWARSPRALPIPGFRSVAQIEDNVGAVAFGPLDPDQVEEIDRLLQRQPVS